VRIPLPVQRIRWDEQQSAITSISSPAATPSFAATACIRPRDRTTAPPGPTIAHARRLCECEDPVFLRSTDPPLHDAFLGEDHSPTRKPHCKPRSIAERQQLHVAETFRHSLIRRPHLTAPRESGLPGLREREVRTSLQRAVLPTAMPLSFHPHCLLGQSFHALDIVHVVVEGDVRRHQVIAPGNVPAVFEQRRHACKLRIDGGSSGLHGALVDTADQTQRAAVATAELHRVHARYALGLDSASLN
jgi:hypothetical protein